MPTYVPIIKWKAGEQRALKELAPSTKSETYPLFLVSPIPWDFDNDDFKCSVDVHLNNFGTKLKNIWGTTQPIMIDAEQVDNYLMCDASHPIKFIIQDAEAQGVKAIPVVGFDKSVDYISSVAWIATTYKRGIAVRIKQSDFSRVATSLSNLLATLGITMDQVDLIIDCEEINSKLLSLVVTATSGLMTSIPNLASYRTVTVAAASFPKSLAGISNYSVKEFPRVELNLWKDIKRTVGAPLNLMFGDYTIDDPYWPDQINPRLLINAMNGNVRYTKEAQWYVAKGEKLYGAIGFRQFTKVTDLIVNHPSNIFCGQIFSAGDKRIYDCANRHTPNTGNAGTWIQAGVNHHITFVVNQFSNLPALLSTP